MTGPVKECVLPERLVAGRAPGLLRAERSGWSRTWQYSGPHYFERGSNTALCGTPISAAYGFTLHDEPDGQIPQSDGRKTACQHCLKRMGSRK